MKSKIKILEINKYKVKVLFIFFFINIPSLVNAQVISGKIKNTDGIYIKNANVIAKDSLKSLSIKAFAIANNGYYILVLP